MPKTTKENLVAVRKYLHQHPELSGKELKTSAFLRKYIEEYHPEAQITLITETGFAVRVKGESVSPVVLCRAELDALPIQETNNFTHKSQEDHISHKCGHDGHMTILLRLLQKLQKEKPKGEVILLFQPAEEIGEGAKEILNSKTFNENFDPAYVLSLHNVPGYPMHEVQIKKGEFTPSVISCDVKLTGKTAHAAEPQNGINPHFAAAEIISSTQSMFNNDFTAKDFSVIALVYSDLGSRDFGISAGTGQMGFTLRTKTNEQMFTLKKAFTNMISEVCERHGIHWQIDWTQEFNSIKNDQKVTKAITNSAQNLGYKVVNREGPFPWGEDFGLFTEKYKGAMFGLGAGEETPALHNPDYDFPDELIDTGAKIFYETIKTLQK